MVSRRRLQFTPPRRSIFRTKAYVKRHVDRTTIRWLKLSGRERRFGERALPRFNREGRRCKSRSRQLTVLDNAGIVNKIETRGTDYLIELPFSLVPNRPRDSFARQVLARLVRRY